MMSIRDKAICLLSSWVPELLARQDEHGVFWPDAGRPARFNTDYQQFGYYPLALLYATEHCRNPYTGDDRLFRAVERSIRNNLAITDDRGQSLASSHDLEPSRYANNWRSFSWLQTINLLRGRVDASLVQESLVALATVKKAMESLAREVVTEPGFAVGHNARNHPVWVLLAAHCLARQFNDSPLRDWSAAQLDRICAAQHPVGLWMEHDGPVTVYQHVTLSAISHYHHLTGSPVALEAMQRALGFHRIMTYPNGHPVETIDGRVRYTGYTMAILPAAWATTPEGLAYLHFLFDTLLTQPMGQGYHTHRSWLALPFLAQFIQDLPEEQPHTRPLPPPLLREGIHVLGDLPVRVLRQAPWAIVLSGLTRPETPNNRWTLDYQSHLSVFHDRSGLILGGGGGKRQAALSLFHDDPHPLGLPTLARRGTVQTISPSAMQLLLQYDTFTAALTVDVSRDHIHLVAAAQGSDHVYLQLQFPLKGDSPITTAYSRTWPIDAQSEILPHQIGDTLGRQGLFTITGLHDAHAMVHLLPYNTHWKNGWAHDDRAVGVIAQPLANGTSHSLTLSAGTAGGG